MPHGLHNRVLEGEEGASFRAHPVINHGLRVALQLVCRGHQDNLQIALVKYGAMWLFSLFMKILTRFLKNV